jgi:hypothetical protein
MDEHALPATVTHISDQGAQLDIAGQSLTWPFAGLPDGVRAGDRVMVRVMTEEEARADHHERARAILSEILGSRP